MRDFTNKKDSYKVERKNMNKKDDATQQSSSKKSNRNQTARPSVNHQPQLDKNLLLTSHIHISPDFIADRSSIVRYSTNNDVDMCLEQEATKRQQM